MGRLTAARREELIGLLSTMRNNELAKRFGVSREWVRQLRHKHKISGPVSHYRERILFIKSNQKLGPQKIANLLGIRVQCVRKIMREEGIEYKSLRITYKEGEYPTWLKPIFHRLGKESDKSLAKEVKREQTRISGWRTRLGIPPFYKRHPKVDYDEIVRLLKTFTVRETARRMNVSTVTVTRAKRVRGLPIRACTKVTPEMEERVEELYETHSDKKLSQLLGISPTTVRRIRDRKGLSK